MAFATDDSTFQPWKYLVGLVTNVAMTYPSPLGSYSKNLLARHCHCNVGLFSTYYKSMIPKSMCKPLWLFWQGDTYSVSLWLRPLSPTILPWPRTSAESRYLFVGWL